MKLKNKELFFFGNEFLKIEYLDKMTKERKKQIMYRSNDRIDEIKPFVSSIINEIKEKGDEALLRYTKKFDDVKMTISEIIVTKAEIKEAYKKVNENPDNKNLIRLMQDSIDCIKGYHEGEKARYLNPMKRWEKSVNAKTCNKNYEKCIVGQIYNPLNRIGIYVPGGNAVLFSTALMAITPAKVAGVKEIIVASPPSRNGNIDPKIIVASDLAGADLIIKAGGAQAIAALACGTKTIPKVDKIFGPGNIYVTAAKSYVLSKGICAIDFIAGPSEIFVVADKNANYKYIARDMISQAEHDSNACAILLTDSEDMAKKVRNFIINILKAAIKKDDLAVVATNSLTRYGAIIKVKDINEAIAFSNEFAPEHLEIMTEKPRTWLDRIRNAGTICLGMFTPVAISDYVCPNHILPTGGAARYTSGINIEMFFKKTSFLKTEFRAMPWLSKMVVGLSKAEGLYNQHGLSVEARLSYRKRKIKK